MIIFAVTREGIRRHEILGLYDNPQDAISRAKKAKADDSAHRVCKCKRCDEDDYHSYDVLQFKLNEAVDDGTVVFSVPGRVNP